AAALPRTEYDRSGFPGRAEKAESSSARFVTFFLATPERGGPLFTLGLAAPAGDGSALLTPGGLDLLRRLHGLGCRRGRELRPEWRAAFLGHLAGHAPADFKFLEELVGLVSRGVADRGALTEALASRHPDWSAAVA